LSVISGDNNAEKRNLEQWMSTKAHLLFDQSPQDKLAYIESLQKSGERVMMVGDGLNDAGALKQSHAGIAVTSNINNFSPACDAIMEASQLQLLPQYIRMTKAGKNIVTASFIMSICYNIIGLSFAVQGTLSPLIAAILMPASSISIVLFTWLAVQISGKHLLPHPHKP
jgi:Cu+-exporting ATPase